MDEGDGLPCSRQRPVVAGRFEDGDRPGGELEHHIALSLRLGRELESGEVQSGPQFHAPIAARARRLHGLPDRRLSTPEIAAGREGQA